MLCQMLNHEYGSAIVMLMVIAVFFAVVFLVVLVGQWRNAPRVISWTNAPMGRRPVTIAIEDQQYICVPIEDETNSWQYIEDVMAAADKLREDRRAAKG